MKQIEIYPINATISFKYKSSAKENIFFDAIGLAFKNIDNASIQLKGLKLNNILNSQQGITDTFTQYYINQAKGQLFEIIGSINIIGNPVGLVKNIGQGFQDLIEFPSQGFVQGPLQGMMGLAKGSKSFTQKTISGLFNSVYNITDSLGSGISYLTKDDSYLSQREQIKNQTAENAFQGFELGAYSIVSGFGQGLKGIVSKPLEGAEKEGLEGFFKGTLQGITGLILKPAAGFIDGASKIAEGIKNTTGNYDEKEFLEQRERHIRVFYRREKQIQEYNPFDAYIMNFFQTYQEGILKKITFLETIQILNSENQPWQALILSIESVILFDFMSKDVLIEFKSKNLKKIILEKPKIFLQIEREEFHNIKTITLHIENEKICNEVFTKLSNLKESLFDM